MSLRASRQFVILVRKPLHDFRPWDICTQLRVEGWYEDETRECEVQSPKIDLIGPPIRISMGSRFHSYS